MYQTGSLPDTYAKFDNKKLLYVYDAAPRRVREILEGLSEKELKERPRPGKWSIFETVVHLADAEIVGAMRIRQTFTQSDRQFGFYDQEAWAEKLKYQELSMAAFYYYVKSFEMLRLTTSTIFHNATKSDWLKTGFHPELGEVSLRQLLEVYADHGERHIQQVLQCRELIKKPISFPMLLEERLY